MDANFKKNKSNYSSVNTFMKLSKLFKLTTATLLTIGALSAASVLQTPAATGLVTLSWDYPANEISGVLFKIRGSIDPNLNKTNWPVLLTVTNGTTATVQITPGQYFFTGTASNLWGETIFFPVVATPALPRSDVVVKIIDIK
jgi:hypothetical protein